MTARVQARDSFRRRLIAAAYARLATQGAAGLRMRQLARDLGVTPGALYRYVAGRDELLTILVVDAYEALSEAARQADSEAPRSDLEGRWTAIWHAVRTWALEHRNEYQLIYGTPIPGYRAPADTIRPASSITLLLGRICSQLWDTGRAESRASEPAPEGLAEDVTRIRAWIVANGLPADAPDAMILATVEAWTTLMGAVSLELSGHYVGSIHNGAAHLDLLARRSFGILAAMAHS